MVITNSPKMYFSFPIPRNKGQNWYIKQVMDLNCVDPRATGDGVVMIFKCIIWGLEIDTGFFVF